MNSQLRLLVGCVLMFCASSPPGGFWARIPHGRWVVPTTTRSPRCRCGAAQRGHRPRWRTAHRDVGLCSPRGRRPTLCSSHPASLAHLAAMKTLSMSVSVTNTLYHLSWLAITRARGPTIKELGALGVALLHLLTLVCCCLNVTDGGGQYCSAWLHQHLTEVDAVAGGSAVQRGPARATVKHSSD